MPSLITFDTETEWEDCVGGLGCEAIGAPTILTGQVKKFSYPFDIEYSLPEGTPNHKVEVKVVTGESYYPKGRYNPIRKTWTVTIDQEPNFDAAGSADVFISSVNMCGKSFLPKKSYLICDNDRTRGINFEGPKSVQRDEVMHFEWPQPALQEGTRYEIEYYTKYRSDGSWEVLEIHENGGIDPIMELEKGFKQGSHRHTASELIGKIDEVGGKHVIFKQHAYNRCFLLGTYSPFWVYEKKTCKVDKHPEQGGECFELELVDKTHEEHEGVSRNEVQIGHIAINEETDAKVHTGEVEVKDVVKEVITEIGH